MYISVDIEADGPTPTEYSMLSLGAVVVEEGLSRTFYAEMKPRTPNFDWAALKSIGWSREHTLSFPEPEKAITAFHGWLTPLKLTDKRLTFVSDNPIFDGMFVFSYLHDYMGVNLFGFSGFSLTSFAKGWERDMHKNHKHLRKTKHTHNALDDAIGNAEAMLYYLDKMKPRYA